MSFFRPRTKRILQLLAIALLVATSIGATYIIHHGKRLASPERRPLQDYHQDYFQKSTQHGIHIEHLKCLDGKAPCLIISPDSSATLGSRGTLIRQQISSTPITFGSVIGNVVLLHGRNGRKEDLLPVAERFYAVGLRCIIPDLPAHGDSPIKASHFGLKEWEQGMPARVLGECAQHFNFDETPAALWGISMGGSFATSAASRDNQPWSCLTIVSSFDRLDKVIENQCHSGTIAKLVSGVCQKNGGPKLSEVRPESWATEVQLPVLVAHGNEDELIDLQAGRALFSSFPAESKRWVEVAGGTHTNVLTTKMPLYALMADWIIENLSGAQTAE